MLTLTLTTLHVTNLCRHCSQNSPLNILWVPAVDISFPFNQDIDWGQKASAAAEADAATQGQPRAALSYTCLCSEGVSDLLPTQHLQPQGLWAVFSGRVEGLWTSEHWSHYLWCFDAWTEQSLLLLQGHPATHNTDIPSPIGNKRNCNALPQFLSFRHLKFGSVGPKVATWLDSFFFF